MPGSVVAVLSAAIAVRAGLQAASAALFGLEVEHAPIGALYRPRSLLPPLRRRRRNSRGPRSPRPPRPDRAARAHIRRNRMATARSAPVAGGALQESLADRSPNSASGPVRARAPRRQCLCRQRSPAMTSRATRRSDRKTATSFNRVTQASGINSVPMRSASSGGRRSTCSHSSFRDGRPASGSCGSGPTTCDRASAVSSSGWWTSSAPPGIRDGSELARGTIDHWNTVTGAGVDPLQVHRHPTTVEVAREIGYDVSGLNRGELLAHAAR